MASGPSAKRNRKDFTVSEKVQVIEYKKENPNASVRAIAEKFNCGKSQIQSILAKRTEVLDEYSANKNALSERARARTDEATYEWYQKARLKNIPVTGPLLQEEAKRASEEPGDSELTASNGWLDRFKKRFNIKSGEAGGVREETELADSDLVQVNSLLRDASSGSATDAPSAGEALKADSTLPTCAEMTANWEEEFFSSLSASTSQNSPHARRQ
ncbi:major centromere autoantigen B-like [Montipora capricornis]|uniref:major centromere autoantigen B-like n=1 Tax=Montipora capricornis TaxID=246305 RepID=UPI0035F19BAD